MSYVQGTDRLGNRIWFDPQTGDVMVLPPPDDGPPPPPPPPPATTHPPGSDGTGGLGQPPPPTGGCWVTLADVYRWFVQYLGGPPHDDAEAIGYGRIGLACDQVIAEIASSPEAQAFAASHVPAPSRVPQTHPPGTVIHPPGTCPAGQHMAFGVGPCIPDTIGPDLPPELSQVMQEILAELDVLTMGGTKDIRDIANDVIAALTGKTSPLLADINKIADSLKGQLSSMLGGLPAQVAQLVGAGLTGAESIAAAFLSNAATVEDVAGAAVKAVKGQKSGLFEFLLGLMMSGGSAIAQQTIGAIAQPPPAVPPPPPGLPIEPPSIAPEIEVPIAPAADPRDPLTGIAEQLELALGFLGGLLAFLEPGSEQVRQYAWATAPIRLVDGGTAVAAEVKGFISSSVAAEISKRGGMNAYMHAIERELARARPGTSEVIGAWNRDEINTEQMLRGLARLGYDDDARELLIAVSRTLLGPDAMARLSDRDLAQIGGSVTFGGIHEMTAEFVREGLNAGYARDDIDRAWQLHYVPPNVGEAADLLHRGAIPIEAYRAALRANAVPPEWRAAYEVAAFVPFSRRDWLRLIQHKLIDHAGLVRSIMDNGYDATRAELLAVLFEELAAETKKAAKDPLVGPLTTQLLALREEGVVSQADAENGLAALGHKPDEIGALLVETELRREVKRIAEVVRQVRPLYVNEYWDWPRTATELSSWGIDADHQAELKREWDLGRALTDQKPHQARAHELTVAEVTAAFVDGEITDADFRSRLAALRFSPQDVDLEVHLALVRRHKAEQADEVAQIEHAVLQGSITEHQASDLLDAIGVTPGKRDRLLDGWLKKHANRREILTTAQLTSLLSAEIINDEDLHDYMLRLPYGDQERVWLEALIGSKAAASQARAASAAAKAARKLAAAATVEAP